jgi:putative DNA primase/helicase
MSKELGNGYCIDEHGVWFSPSAKPDKEGNSVERDPTWLCAPLKVKAFAVDEEDRWGKLLEWADPDKNIVTWMMPDRLLAENDKIWGALREKGLHMTTEKTSLGLLRKYLNSAETKERWYVCNRLGWITTKGGSSAEGAVERDGQLSYVLPDRVIGNATNVYYQGDQLSYTVRGTLEDWQRQIGRYCRGNSRMLFMVSAAFVSPLLYPMGEQSGGYHIPGLSSTGKSTVVEAANTVAGWSSRSWRTTDNGLESVAEQRCDSVLVLDEMGEVDAHVAGKIAYMIANGEGKTRATVTGEARRTKRWRTILLSSGEITLADKMNEAGEKRRGGQETRLVDIPADAGAGMGCFEDIHGAIDSRAFADQLRHASKEVSGTTFLKYLEELFPLLNSPDRGRFLKSLREKIDTFVDTNAADVTPQVKRVCARFALAAVAGELATTFGITQWENGEATQAAQTCYRAWLDQRGHSGDNDIELGIQQVIAYIEKFGVSRFEPIGCGEGEFVQTYNGTRMGYRKYGLIESEGKPLVEKMMDEATAQPSVWQYYVLPKAWKEITKGYNPNTIANAMIERGLMLNKEKGHLTSKIRTPEGLLRVYCLSPNILVEE